MKLLISILQYVKRHNFFAVLLYLIIVAMPATAQFNPYNLVPNYSFEQYTNCPSNATLAASKNSKPDIWYKPDRRDAVYYNACANNDMDGVPVNFGGGGYYGFQYPRTGNGYMSMYYYNTAEYRNYIQVELLDSLRQGKCYYAEYYVNLHNFSRVGCNNQGMLFTKNTVYVDTNAIPNVYLLPANPQIQNPYIVTDTLNWVKVAGVFTAQGGEKYLTLGNFKNNAQTSILQIQPTGHYSSAYYMDDVNVLPLDSITLQADAGEDKTITAGDSTFIGSFTTGLTNVTWYNSAGNVIATNVSGLYVQPATSTFYVIEQTVCGQYSTDTVYITVGVVPLKFLEFTLVPLSLGEGLGVRWTTAHEINVSHFNVQRSSNGRDFYTIQKVTAKNKTYNEYSVTDIQPLNGTSYYRIESIDKDGKVSYSKTLQTTLNIKPETLNVYPNPAISKVNINFANMQQVYITDVAGRILLNKQLSGVNTVQINVSNIGKGMFFVKVIDTKGNSNMGKLLIQ